jgi:bacterioferritin-associated ferredoxin
MRIISICVLSTLPQMRNKGLAAAAGIRENRPGNENDSHYIVKTARNPAMIVCVCNNISDREIRQAVELGISSMAELHRELGVGTCCGKCVSYAREVLHAQLDQTTVTELRYKAPQAA